MTVYLRVERLGSLDKIICLRSLSATIGYDQNGFLSTSEPMQPMLTLTEGLDGVSITAYGPDLTINNRLMRDNETDVLHSGGTFRFGRYSFNLLKSTAAIEALCHSKRLQEEQYSEAVKSPFPYEIRFQIGSLLKRMPLLPNSEFSVGSSKEDTLVVDIDGVHARHVIIRTTSKTYEVLESEKLEISRYSSRPSINGNRVRMNPIGLCFDIVEITSRSS